VARQQAMEEPTVAVRPIHHGGYRKATSMGERDHGGEIAQNAPIGQSRVGTAQLRRAQGAA
ncbi:MAG: hypothetical protein ACOH2M_19430, partial [Cypionkella sp.]